MLAARRRVGHLSEQLAVVIECPDEMCRFGACELHSMGAFMGGVVAQEVIKLITNQYIPACNTYLYNGITGEGLTAML